MSVIEMTENEMITQTENTEPEKGQPDGDEDVNTDPYNITLRKKYNEIWKRLMKDE